jgi:diguanylate cyclase (GGDEF)-like protein
MRFTDIRVRVVASLRRSLSRATPHVVFPAIAVLVLLAIWGTTLNLIRVQRTAAEHAAAVSSHELAATYEAQVVRALREIDQALKLVKYAHELRGEQVVLRELKARALLPPDLLFVVSIANSKGDITASTHSHATINIADQDYFQSQRLADVLAVGRARQSPVTGEWTLEFSRRLNAANGTFSGIVMVSVDAAYFVSGYEASQLGEHGVLGILGTDGAFRARRSGEVVFAGDSVNYADVVPATDESATEGIASTNSWDGVRRYTSARQLYDFPLAVIVGLSIDEQLAATGREMHGDLWRAAAGSLLLLLIVGVLARMNRQLSLSRLLVAQEQVAHAERVEYLAYHDGLTTLPNRSLFNKILGQSITQARRYKRQMAMLFLDLDLFKNINDTLGHRAGDQLLQEVAVRLKACLRDSDTVARLGGDEFVALLPELDEERYAAIVAQKILIAIARPFILFGHEFRVTASIGISIYPQDGLDEQTLKKNADLAMYQAKEEGKNNFQFYSRQLNADSIQRRTLEAGLRNALERKEFTLHYRAKRDIRSSRITGMEAVLRWEHPDLGTIAPMQCMPVAEDTGLIVPIGKWILRTACLQNVAWQKQGLPRLSLAVNLSARQFCDEHLLQDLKAILDDTGMDADLLELEINESVLMRDVDKALRVLAGIKNMGIRIAVDDFGIGYTALSTLQHFPFDTVKIDCTFIRDLTSLAEDRDLTETIIALGRNLSLTVVAAGVETDAQADFLRKSAGDEFQSFYFNQPAPGDQITALLREQADSESGGTLAAA